MKYDLTHDVTNPGQVEVELFFMLNARVESLAAPLDPDAEADRAAFLAAIDGVEFGFEVIDVGMPPRRKVEAALASQVSRDLVASRQSKEVDRLRSNYDLTNYLTDDDPDNDEFAFYGPLIGMDWNVQPSRVALMVAGAHDASTFTPLAEVRDIINEIDVTLYVWSRDNGWVTLTGADVSDSLTRKVGYGASSLDLRSDVVRAGMICFNRMRAQGYAFRAGQWIMPSSLISIMSYELSPKYKAVFEHAPTGLRKETTIEFTGLTPRHPAYNLFAYNFGLSDVKPNVTYDALLGSLLRTLDDGETRLNING
jgi:hypothetical protein